MNAIAESQVTAKPAQQNLKRHACRFNGCGKTFIRKEHLTRHEKSHTSPRSLICHICQRGFTRNDILQRHISRHKNSADGTDRNERACDGCNSRKTRCEGGIPCSSCARKGIECRYERDDWGSVKDSLSQNTHVAQNVANIGGEEEPQGGLDGEDFIEDNLMGENLNGLSMNMTIGEPEVELQHQYPASNHMRIQPEPGDGAMNLMSGIDSFDRLDIQKQSDEIRFEHFAAGFHMSATGHLHPGEGEAVGGLAQSTTAFTSGNSPNFHSYFLSPNGESFSANAENSQVPRDSSQSIEPASQSSPNFVREDYFELYLAHFHHRWPILHVPSFNQGRDPYVLTASVDMIGAWLHGACNSRVLAITLHDRLMNHIFQRLYQRPAYDGRYKNWSMALYQAALLNIIYGIYCGKDGLLSRVFLMQNLLVASLRELGFFRPEIAMLQEKDATFYPFIQIKNEERKRLVAALFKMDCYLALFRGHPMTLRCEELCFPLTCTFALWNGFGLKVWELRYPDEPLQRSQETMSILVSDISPSLAAQPFILVEDIQLGFCSIHSDIWQYSERAYTSEGDDMSNLASQKSLRERLDFWKCILDQTVVQESGAPVLNPPGKTNIIPLRHYHGAEDHSKPGWHATVKNRPQTLLLDTALLYHLLSLHLHANIRCLGMLVSSKNEGANPLIALDTKDQERRARQWTKTSCARRALWHTASIINICNGENDIPGARGEVMNGTAEPIIAWAVSTAALVVQVYSCLIDTGCALCDSSASPPKSVELFDFLKSKADLDNWINVGGTAAMGGIVLCKCNVDRLIGKFRDCIPYGKQKWGLMESIAWVFKEGI